MELQLGVEGKLDLIPVSDFPGRLALLVELRRFQVAEVADIVGRLVIAFDKRGGSPGAGSRTPRGKIRSNRMVPPWSASRHKPGLRLNWSCS